MHCYLTGFRKMKPANKGMLTVNFTRPGTNLLRAQFSYQSAEVQFLFETPIYCKSGISGLRQLKEWEALSKGDNASIMTSNLTNTLPLRRNIFPIITLQDGIVTFAPQVSEVAEDARFKLQFKSALCLDAFNAIFMEMQNMLKGTPTPEMLWRNPALLLDQVLSWDGPGYDSVERYLNVAFLRESNMVPK